MDTESHISVTRRWLERIGIGDHIVDDVVDEVRDGGPGVLWRRAAVDWLSRHTDALWITVVVAGIYRIATLLTIPGLVPVAVREFRRQMMLGEAGAFELVSGGNMPVLSPLLFGIMPYVNASLVVQLAVFGWRAVTGRDNTAPPRDMAIASGFVAAIWSALQAQGFVSFLEQQSKLPGGLTLVAHPGWGFRITTVATILAATALFMWISDSITRSGIANGMVVTFIAGIVAGLPDAFDGERSLSFSLVVKLAMILAVVVGTSRGYRRALLTPTPTPHR